jgi:uncharacterized membrane protein
MKKVASLISALMPFLVLGLSGWVLYAVARFFWHQLLSLKPELSVALLTAATTVLVATLSVLLARYFEKKKEVEAQFRSIKTETYDAFLKQFFQIYHEPNKEGIDLVAFFREWQRKITLWGGTDTLVAFMQWREHLAKGVPDAKSMMLTDGLFRAIRKDIGLSNFGLAKGFFVRMILRNPDIFFAMYRQNPNVTLSELAAREKQLGRGD